MARMGEKTNALRILVGKPQRRTLLEKSRYIWQDNIEIIIKVIRWDGVD